MTKVSVGDHVVMSAAYCGHCQQCEFPIAKLVKTYDFADINSAFADSESGDVVKPLLVF